MLYCKFSSIILPTLSLQSASVKVSILMIFFTRWIIRGSSVEKSTKIHLTDHHLREVKVNSYLAG